MSTAELSDPARLRQLNELLQQALAMQPAAQEAWLQRLPPDQQPLVPLLRGMLARAALDADTFMQRPVEWGLEQAAELEAVDDQAGDTVGPYRLVRSLGRGGMATVWLAERLDGLLTQRDVALKLPRTGFALGLAQRMARERDILAALAHPHIARLYDAGLTAEGRPWLAMECVHGEPIDVYCRAQALDVTERLKLFLQVADAVAHAHARLIVHRDLKPNNILVGADGQVKLLDFGVAKLLEDEPEAGGTLTRTIGRAATPDYAAPEQLAGRPVTVAADVYSLGIVLYELLTGQRPYRVTQTSAAALEEAILAADVPLASTRALPDRRLARQLRGDLDNVLAKALRKDPARRYLSVEAMAADVDRYLRGEPVLAQRRSTSYRLAKFVRRHRLQVALGVGVSLAVLAAAVIALVQADAARGQAERAQREAQRAQAVQDMLLGLFQANTAAQADPVRARQTTVRELLDIGAAKAAASLEGAPDAQDTVLDTLADMYYQLELGEKAARMRAQRVAALKKAYGNDDRRVADALIAYANDVNVTDQPGRAAAALDEAGQILDRLRDQTSPSRGWLHIERARMQMYLSVPAMRREAEAALLHFQRHPGRWHDEFHAQQLMARAWFLSGDMAQAAAGHRDALALAEREMQGPSAWSITPRVQMAEAQIAAMDPAGAEAQLRAALELARRVGGDAAGSTLQTQAKLAMLLHAGGRRDEALQLVEAARTTLERLGPRASPEVLGAVQRARGVMLFAEGRVAEAEASLAAEVADLQRQLPGSLPLARARGVQAAPLVAMGRLDAAGAALDDAQRIWSAGAGSDVDPALANRLHLERARLHFTAGDDAAAEAAIAQMAPSRYQPMPPLRLEDTQARLLRSQIALKQGRGDDARSLAEAALEHLRGSPLRERHARLEAEALLRHGQARLQLGQPATARAELERALALRRGNESDTSPWLAETQLALAECLLAFGERKAARELLEQARAIHARHAELAAPLRQPLNSLAQRLR